TGHHGAMAFVDRINPRGDPAEQQQRHDQRPATFAPAAPSAAGIARAAAPTKALAPLAHHAFEIGFGLWRRRRLLPPLPRRTRTPRPAILVIRAGWLVPAHGPSIHSPAPFWRLASFRNAPICDAWFIEASANPKSMNANSLHRAISDALEAI